MLVSTLSVYGVLLGIVIVVPLSLFASWLIFVLHRYDNGRIEFRGSSKTVQAARDAAEAKKYAAQQAEHELRIDQVTAMRHRLASANDEELKELVRPKKKLDRYGNYIETTWEE